MLTTTSDGISSESALFARQLLARLASGPIVVGSAGSDTTIPLPPHIATLFQQVLTALAAGHTVEVSEHRTELTPNEAADYLNVSRPYVIKLIDEGVLPARMVGSHRRIPYADLAAYKVEQSVRSRAAMTELVRISEELGLYEDPQPMPPKSAYRDGSAGL
jgi:excisionase family DNA binding protein